MSLIQSSLCFHILMEIMPFEAINVVSMLCSAVDDFGIDYWHIGTKRNVNVVTNSYL